MKKILLSLVVAVLLASSATVAMAAPGGVTGSGALKDLATARQATAKYHDVSVAIADGYVPASPCISAPPGVMGIHYVNFGLVDDTVNLTTPEILLYVATDGGMKLVGVEYMAVSVGQPAPTLFGRAMNGPMPGHGPGEPEHFDLHVWLWQGNPNGIFEAFNPKVKC